MYQLSLLHARGLCKLIPTDLVRISEIISPSERSERPRSGGEIISLIRTRVGWDLAPEFARPVFSKKIFEKLFLKIFFLKKFFFKKIFLKNFF